MLPRQSPRHYTATWNDNGPFSATRDGCVWSCSNACDFTRTRGRRLTPTGLIVAAVLLLLSHGPLTPREDVRSVRPGEHGWCRARSLVQRPSSSRS